MDETDFLDINLATILEYVWRSAISMEQFIAGFHAPLDNISEPNIVSKLKSNLTLNQAGVDLHTRKVILEFESVKYNIH